MQPRSIFRRLANFFNGDKQAARRDPFADLIRDRVGQVRRGEYEPIGIINEIQTAAALNDPQKVISFGTGRGLGFGRFADGRIDLLDAWEWDGLPDRYVTTAENCPECEQVDCKECFPGDTTLAEFVLPFAAKWETGERRCVFGNQFSACSGLGVIRDIGTGQVIGPCPSCGGSGKIVCPKCGGKGSYSTGRLHHPDAARGFVGRLCPRCHGSGRKLENISQNIGQYLVNPIPFGELNADGNRIRVFELGPIHGFMATGRDKHTQLWLGRPDEENNYPHIVSVDGIGGPAFTPGARAVILGGILRLK